MAKRYTIEFQVVEVNEFGENIDTVDSCSLGYATKDKKGLDSVFNTILELSDHLVTQTISTENLEAIDE